MQRLAAWKDLSRRHEDRLKKRVQADELRGKARFKRQELMEKVKTLSKGSSESTFAQSSRSRKKIFDLRDLTSDTKDLEQLEQLVEEQEDELVRAES